MGMRSLAVLLLASALSAADLPDPKLTPGATVNVPLARLCRKGYATSVRNVSGPVKKSVFAEYGLPHIRPGRYEVDHLISLELGGSNDLENLWPQSYSGEWNAHVKDALEDRLHALVCAANPTMTLEQAQHAIRTDWIAAYKKVFATDEPVKTGAPR
jgi:hypothetical protein